MIKWLSKTVGACLIRYVNRRLRKLLDSGDYEVVLVHTAIVLRRHENDVTALYWRALALLWLERCQEALDIADRVERLQAEGVLKLTDQWLNIFDELKCGALSGLGQYDALDEFGAKCLERHEGVIPLAAFQLLATLHLGTLTVSTPCLNVLDCSTNKFDQAWQFAALYEAQRRLGNKVRASEIARLSLSKHPDNVELREIAKSKHSSSRTCQVRPSHPRPIR